MGLKKGLNNHTTLVGDLSTSLSTMDRSSGPKKIKKEASDVTSRASGPDGHAQSTPPHSSRAHPANFTQNVLQKRPCASHKTSLSKIREPEVIPEVKTRELEVFSSHRGVRRQLNRRRKAGKVPSVWKRSYLNHRRHARKQWQTVSLTGV